MPASVHTLEPARVHPHALTVLPVTTRTRRPLPTTRVDFGTYLKQLAEAAGFSQAELAKTSGVNQAQLSRAYDNLTTPTVDTLRKLAPHLRVRLGDLMVQAGLATREELGMVGQPPAPAVSLPPVLRSILSRLASPRYKQRHKDVLLAFVQDDVDRWDSMIEQIEQERAEAMRGRR